MIYIILNTLLLPIFLFPRLLIKVWFIRGITRNYNFLFISNLMYVNEYSAKGRPPLSLKPGI